MTKYSVVSLESLCSHFGYDQKNVPHPLIADKARAMDELRNGGLINVNRKPHGIPQGSPISAVFANVSMIEFDAALLAWAESTSSEYMRYSDDILIITDKKNEAAALLTVSNAAKAIGSGLIINKEKTEISRFSRYETEIRADLPLTYLGFTFDGINVSLRHRTISRYYRRMTYATRGSVRGARKAGQLPADAFRRSLFRDFSHLGRSNFYSYAKKADNKFFRSIVKRQLRRHFLILLRKLEQRGR